MGLFNRKPSELGRVADALERLLALYELDLASRGISTRTGAELGEVLETDPEEMALQERYDELRELYGLPPGVLPTPVRPDGTGWTAPEPEPTPAAAPPPIFHFPNSWDFPVGPEGAEGTGESAGAEWSGEGGAASLPEGRRGEAEPEG